MANKEGTKKSNPAEKEDVKEEKVTPENVEEQPKEEAPETDAPQSETDTLTAELNEWKEKYEKQNKEYLLSLAEFDNYRKRTLREKADLIKSGGENCLKDLLPVIDDFERGLQATEKETDGATVREGMELIYKKFITYMEKNGVKAIETKEQAFDTEFHEAVTTFPAPTPELKGKIIDCVQKGYTLNEKVIRYAKVVVGE